jgi:ribosomal protein S27E
MNEIECPNCYHMQDYFTGDIAVTCDECGTTIYIRGGA